MGCRCIWEDSVITKPVVSQLCHFHGHGASSLVSKGLRRCCKVLQDDKNTLNPGFSSIFLPLFPCFPGIHHHFICSMTTPATPGHHRSHRRLGIGFHTRWAQNLRGTHVGDDHRPDMVQRITAILQVQNLGFFES